MGVLPAVADLVLKTGLWFLVTGIVLYLVARAYVSALLSLRSRSGISKLAGGVALWGALAGAVLLPLFGALSLTGVRDAFLTDVWFLGWLVFAYATIIPIIVLVSLGYVTDEVKLVAVAKDIATSYVLPSADTVNDGSYPIARDLYMYSAGKPTGAILEYINWIYSADAQQIVKSLGFVPIEPN